MNESTKSDSGSNNKQTTPGEPPRPLKYRLFEVLLYGGVGAVVMAVLFAIGLAMSDSIQCDEDDGTRCERVGHQVQLKRSSQYDEIVEQERQFTTKTLEHQRNVFELCRSLKEAQAKLSEAIVNEEKEQLRNNLLASLLRDRADQLPAPPQLSTKPLGQPVGVVDWPLICQQAYQEVSDGVLVEDRRKALRATTNASQTRTELGSRTRKKLGSAPRNKRSAEERM